MEIDDREGRSAGHGLKSRKERLAIWSPAGGDVVIVLRAGQDDMRSFETKRLFPLETVVAGATESDGRPIWGPHSRGLFRGIVGEARCGASLDVFNPYIDVLCLEIDDV